MAYYPSEAIKIVMKEQDVTSASMSRRIGITPQTMFDRLGRTEMRVSTFCQMARVLGKKLVLVDDNKKVMPGEYEIK